MQLDRRIEHLIRVASHHMAGHVDGEAFRTVSEQALNCVKALVGEDHPYTSLLEEVAEDGKKKGLSTACGVLWAAKLLEENETYLAKERKDSVGSWREWSGQLS